MNTAIATKKLSDREKEELIKEALGNKYSSVGRNLPILKSIIDYVGYADNLFSVAELIKFTNILLTGSRFMTVVANSASVLSIFLSPIANMITIINAWQTGHKMYAYRSVAYTITAWAFNKPIPNASNQMLSNLRSGGPTRSPSIVQEYNKIWQKTSRNVINQINAGALSKNVPKDAIKIILRAMGNNNEQKLCEMLLKGLEDQFDPIPKLTWKSLYKIRFPA